MCIILPNFMTIDQTIADLYLRAFNMAVVRHLGFFLKFEILITDTVPRVTMSKKKNYTHRNKP